MVSQGVYLLVAMSGLLLAFAAHYCFSDGRLICETNGSLRRVDRAFDVLLLVLPVFLMGLYLVGFRPLDAGSDTPNYVRAWEALDGFWSGRSIGANQYGNTEFLWWPLQSLFQGLASARGWLALNYLLIFIAVFCAYRALCRHFSVNPLIFPLVFLTYYLIYSGNAMRQALALPIGLLGFCWWFDQRYVRAFLAVVLSVGLHWSSLFFLVTPILTLPLFRKQAVLVGLPLLMLAFSFLVGDAAKLASALLDVPELTVKYELYFEGGRVSHLGPVWQQFNFWLCAGVSILFLMICPPSDYTPPVLHIYVMFFLGLMLFGFAVADVSERFFPALLLVMPLMVVLIIRRFDISSTIAEALLLLAFVSLCFLILGTESAQETLGYSIFK